MTDNSPSRKRPSLGRDWIILIAILLVGAILRLSYWNELKREPIFHAPVADAAFHDYWAKGIVSGNWTVPQGEPDPRIPQVPFLRPPGYAYFLAGIYALFGTDPQNARGVQMLLGLLNCVLAYFLGRAVLNRTAGLILAAFCAVYWAFIYYEAELHAPAVLITLTFALMLTLHAWLRRPGWKKALGAGVLTGAVALLRAETLLFVPVAWLWMAWVRRREMPGWAALRPGVIFALGAVLAIAPATIRNAVVAKEFVPISANAAINFYIGNNETSDGVTTRIPGLSELVSTAGWSCFSYDQIIQAMAQQEKRPLSYTAASKIFNDRALDYISGHFGRFIALTLKRAALFWGPDEVANNTAIEYEKANSPTLRWIPGFAPVVGLSLLGLGLLFAQRKGLLRRASGRPLRAEGVPEPAAAQAHASRSADAMLLAIGLFVLTGFVALLPFIAAARFRAPYIPFIFVFGAYAIERLVAFVRGRSWRPLALSAGVAAVLTALASLSLAGYKTDPAWWHTDRALALWRADRTTEAIAELNRALERNPGFVDAHVNLAALLIQTGRPEEAQAHYRLVLQHRPDRVDLRLKLGSLLLQLGQPAEARTELQAVVERNPNLPEAWFELGRALNSLGDREGSRQAFARTLELSPEEPAAFVNQAIGLIQGGQPREALPLLQRAVQLKPDLTLAYLWLGQAHAALKENDKARVAYQEAIRLDAQNPLPYIYCGILAANERNLDDAIRWLRQAIQIDPQNVAAHYNLAGMLSMQGKASEAIAEFEEVLRLEPGNNLARQHLNRLRSGRP